MSWTSLVNRRLRGLVFTAGCRPFRRSLGGGACNSPAGASGSSASTTSGGTSAGGSAARSVGADSIEAAADPWFTRFCRGGSGGQRRVLWHRASAGVKRDAGGRRYLSGPRRDAPCVNRAREPRHARRLHRPAEPEGWGRQDLDLTPPGRDARPLGRRVLLVDNDPQSSLTQGLGGRRRPRPRPGRTVDAVYRRGARPARSSTHRAWTASTWSPAPARRRVQQRSAVPCVARPTDMPSATSSARRRAATISS